MDSLAKREIVENACVGLESVSPITPSGYMPIELYLPQEPSSDEQCVYILCPLPVNKLFMQCLFRGRRP